MATAKQKSTIDTHTHTKKNNPNTTLKIAIKSQEKRTKEDEKKKDLQSQGPAWSRVLWLSYKL